jgi:hypothetical protein
MSEQRYYYLVPSPPVYAYFFNKTAEGEDSVNCFPVVAFGCWYEEGYNNQEPLILGDGCLDKCASISNFLSIEYRNDLPVSAFKEDIIFHEKFKHGRTYGRK